jgi:DNA-directed RNA polymerase specialized sigma24 family protein
LKKNWSLTESAFQQLLAWLDEGVCTEGDRYLEIRRRLVQYFDRRGCLSADELADETLNRAARKLAEVGHIENVAPAQYCYVLARFVFLEYIRRPGQKDSEFDDTARIEGVAGLSFRPDVESAGETRERGLGSLGRCLEKLPPADQRLILEYYQGDKREKIDRRSKLAELHGLTLNALSVRACRIRNKLEQCVKKSAIGGEVKSGKPSYRSGR